jgi:hypothetical protein
VTPPTPRELRTSRAHQLTEALSALPDTADPAALSRVRASHPEIDPGLIAALATQVRLQRRARDRLGAWAEDMILEEEALQQATRRDVARYRAGRLAERLGAGSPLAGSTVADIGCGLGVDARALAEAGFTVLAFERDTWRAEAAEINLAAWGERVQVLCEDATSVDRTILDECDAAYVDPARRTAGGPRRIDGGRSRAVTSPEAWSPPWPWVVDLAARLPVIAKVAPGFDARQAPEGADLEWIDDRGDTVEVTAWLGALGHGMSRATALEGSRWESIEAERTSTADVGASTSQAGNVLLEPTPAVIRAHLVGELAAQLGAARLDGGTWLTAADPGGSLLAHAWRILVELPHATGDLRTWLRGHGSVTWKTSDTSASASDWDRRVGHRPSREGHAVTIVITGQGRAFAVEPIRNESASER